MMPLKMIDLTNDQKRQAGYGQNAFRNTMQHYSWLKMVPSQFCYHLKLHAQVNIADHSRID